MTSIEKINAVTKSCEVYQRFIKGHFKPHFMRCAYLFYSCYKRGKETREWNVYYLKKLPKNKKI